ncbi:MAG: methyltransferase domain-containing protein [Parvularculaceae bacterium]
MRIQKISVLLACASIVALAACAKKDAAPASDAASETASASDTAQSADKAADATPTIVDYARVAASAVENPGRSEEDRARDGARKARSTLTFFQVAPGDHVFEMEAGGGYFTELLSYAVGPDGHITMQNPQEFLKYVDKELETRFAGDRLPNVTQSISHFDDLDAADNSMDLVTWVQGPHDIWVENKDGEIFADPEKSFAEIYRILKPGGAFVVIDHLAVDDAPASTGNTLHRANMNIVADLATKAGFAPETESLFLNNAEDDRTKSVFDESIRGKTSQFAIRYRKPEAE